MANEPPFNSASNLTFTIDRPCDESTPCEIAEMDHYGERGTGFAWCRAHGKVVGRVE